MSTSLITLPIDLCEQENASRPRPQQNDGHLAPASRDTHRRVFLRRDPGICSRTNFALSCHHHSYPLRFHGIRRALPCVHAPYDILPPSRCVRSSPGCKRDQCVHPSRPHGPRGVLHLASRPGIPRPPPSAQDHRVCVKSCNGRVLECAMCCPCVHSLVGRYNVAPLCPPCLCRSLDTWEQE